LCVFVEGKRESKRSRSRYEAIMANQLFSWRRAGLTLGWTLCGLLVASAIPGSPLRSTPRQPATAALRPTSAPRTVLRTKPIESIRVGDRVLAENPDRDEVDPMEEEPDRTWKVLTIECGFDEGGTLYATLLRPPSWIDSEYDPVQRSVWLELAEFGFEGWGTFTSITDNPVIENRNGRVVTGTFRHTPTAPIVRVTAGGSVVECTTNHPFWSVDRDDFVEAATLMPGDRVLTADGDRTTVACVERGGPAREVYNIEVSSEHVYYVGVDGILVHNKCAGLHHLFPRAFGSLVPYGSKVLLWLTARQHTHIHKLFSKFLVREKGFALNAMSGAQWRNLLTEAERIALVKKFVREYSQTAMGKEVEKRLGHSLIVQLNKELKEALAKGIK
jgi:hypothetical protein